MMFTNALSWQYIGNKFICPYTNKQFNGHFGDLKSGCLVTLLKTVVDISSTEQDLMELYNIHSTYKIDATLI